MATMTRDRAVRDRGGRDDRWRHRDGDCETEGGADDDAEDGSEDGDHGGLCEDHLAGLSAEHPDGAEEADLAGALEDGEGEGVGDAEQCDEAARDRAAR